MSLYNQYSYSSAFCAFHKIVRQTISEHIHAVGLRPNDYLCISPYLEITMSNRKADTSDRLYPISSFVNKDTDGQFLVLNDEIDSLGVELIIKPSEQPETKWDVLHRRMMEDYRSGHFSDVFEPYFKWKTGAISCTDITKEEVFAMAEEVQRLQDIYEAKHPDAHHIHDHFIVDDPWQMTRGYGDDKYMVAYLNYMEDQLDDIRQMI